MVVCLQNNTGIHSHCKNDRALDDEKLSKCKKKQILHLIYRLANSPHSTMRDGCHKAFWNSICTADILNLFAQLKKIIFINVRILTKCEILKSKIYQCCCQIHLKKYLYIKFRKKILCAILRSYVQFF